MNFPAVDHTHASMLTSWVDSANGHADFPIQNLPYGIFSPPDGEARAGLAIGDCILDLRGCADAALLPEQVGTALKFGTLNAFLGMRCSDRISLRWRLSELLSKPEYRKAVEPRLWRAADCVMRLPASIGNYSDFYVGIHHAEYVGRLFRPDSPLMPNYKHVPIGYHGRASSIRPTGVAVIRPSGQRKAPAEDFPVYGPTRRLDYELEIGVWVGMGNELGTPVPIGEANDHIAGLCLLNDWSARDIQAWEYQPLGPFLAKSFHTTISPWIVTTEALAPFRIAQPPRPEGDPRPLPYLFDDTDQRLGALELELTVSLRTAEMRKRGTPPLQLSVGPATNMYWTIGQILTHHASNGCNLLPGDLLGTGTISSANPGGRGSLLEITGGGVESFRLPTGEARTFLEDGDEVRFSAVARRAGAVQIGFGPCCAEIRAST